VVGALIEEVRIAAEKASESADAARTRALDPALPPAEVAAARREMEDATFVRDRMNVAAARLVERLREVERIEQDRVRMARYEIAKIERDCLAKELSDLYPTLAAKLTVLLVQLADNDREIKHINARALPAGAQRLLTAELVARGLTSLRSSGADVPSIVGSVRLPAFRFDRRAAFAWPRPTEGFSARSAGASEPASP
jgi:hypothetical protein